MSSNIDITKPTDKNSSVKSIRDNFATAKTEIETLQSNLDSILYIVSKTIKSSFLPRSRQSLQDYTDVSDIVIASFIIKAGTLGPNSTVKITATWSYTNSTTAKVLTCWFGGQVIGAPQVSTSSSARFMYVVNNSNDNNTQIAFNSTGATGTTNNGIIFLAVNTENDVIVDFRIKWTSITSQTEIVTLEGFNIEVLP